MKEYGGRETGQSSASRRCLLTGFSSFFGALIPTHSLVALLSIWAFSLSSELRPVAGLFVSRSSGAQSLSHRDLSSICPPHVHPIFTSSAFPSSSLASVTTYCPPAASFRTDVLPRSHRMYSVETTFGGACPAAILQCCATFSTLTAHSAAAGRDPSSFPFGVAIPSRATVAAAAPPPLRRRAVDVTCPARPTIAAAGVTAAATFPFSGNRAAEASASCSPPSSAPAPAAAHSPACECRDTGARLTSSPLAEAASACSPATSPATGASTTAAVGLWKLRRRECCCFLHEGSHIKRCPPSKQHSQRLRSDLSSSLSLCRSPAWWARQTRQQQPRCQALAASLSFGSRTSGDRGKNVGQEGGRRRSSSNTSGSSFAAASAPPAASASAASGRETRAGTALFDSQEERFSALKSLKEQETPKFQAEGWNEEMPLLEVKDLHVVAVEDGQEILKGVNLTVMPGEVHAIMGRNGSGKSTLSKVLAGYPSYKVTGGSVRYKGLDLLELAIDNRGLAGLFMAFQYPIEIPMVSNLEFLRVAFNERRKWRGEEEVDSVEFRQFVEGKLQEVGLDPSFLSRPLNYGFSGGEKKRNEILQMIVLDPELVMLDETDSGLDVDSFNVAAAAIKRFAARKNKSFLVTTHYKKLLDVLLPHKIHVMHAGRVILSGDLSLASRIEKEGFASLISDDPREEEEEKRGLARGENLLENDEAYDSPSLSPSAAGGGRRDLDKLL